MKNGYVCKCGWHLERGRGTKKITRPKYAEAKRIHAMSCDALRDELKQSRKEKTA